MKLTFLATNHMPGQGNTIHETSNLLECQRIQAKDDTEAWPKLSILNSGYDQDKAAKIQTNTQKIKLFNGFHFVEKT